MLTKTNQLTPRQLNQLKQLMKICQRVDGSVPNVYPHLLSQPRALPASLLYYQKQQLIGFVSAYFFYEDGCEIALMVAPAARRRGIAKKLLEAILPLVQMQKLVYLVFSSPEKCNTEWLKAQNFAFMHCEYHMERKSLEPAVLPSIDGMEFCEATSEMIPEFCALDRVCFPKENDNNPTNYEGLLENKEEYQLFAIFKDHKLVGKAHLRMKAKGVTFSDIAISPAIQGQGLGSALLAYCINYALKIGKTRLVLDVEAKNARALRIYTKLGFEVKNTCDYWKIAWESLSW